MTMVTTTAAGRWTLDPQTSTASFIAPHLRSEVRGSILFRAATVEFGNRGEVLQATAELDLTAIDTGNPKRDRDLAKPHLLDTGHHPILAVTMDSCSTTETGWTAQDAKACLDGIGTTSCGYWQPLTQGRFPPARTLHPPRGVTPSEVEGS